MASQNFSFSGEPFIFGAAESPPVNQDLYCILLCLDIWGSKPVIVQVH